MELFSKFLGKNYWLVFTASGVLFCLLSFYRISEKLKDPKITEQLSPNYIFLGMGLTLILFSILLVSIREGLLPWKSTNNISDTETGYKASLKQSCINVHFGLLQNFPEKSTNNTVTVLPANDRFDDKCFDDKNISSGAYIHSHFTGSEIEEIKRTRDDQLDQMKEMGIDLGRGKTDVSYKIGTALLISQSGRQMIVSAVSKKTRSGVSSDIQSVYQSVKNVIGVMGSQEIYNCYIPILGSGKGGIPKSIAFQSLLNAFCEYITQSPSHNLKEVHIIVYEHNGASDIDRKSAKTLFSNTIQNWVEFLK